MKPKFVIASVGRSGSGYISQVLKNCDINCGHEEYFCPPWKEPDESLDGDSSWLSINSLHRFNGTVLHQVRDPINVLSSYLYLYPRYMDQRYIPLYNEFINTDKKNIIEKVMSMLHTMNYIIEAYSDWRYKIEDIDSPIKLINLGKRIGFDINPEDAYHALNKVSTSYNYKTKHKKKYQWDEFDDTYEKELLINQYERYGYSIR